MYWKIRNFLDRSIRNKLLVFLPAILVFVLSFFYILSILTLREKVYTYFTKEAKKHLSHLILLHSPMGTHLPSGELNREIPEQLLYFKIFDNKGYLLYQHSLLESGQAPSFIHDDKSDHGQNGFVRKVSFGKTKALEIQERVDGRLGVAGFSVKHIDQLLFSQAITLSVITLIAVIAIVIAIVSLAHLVTDPIRKLAKEADQMTESKIHLKPLSLVERKDEVGFLAKKMNELIKHIKVQEAQIGEQKQNEAMVKIATQVAHDIRSPLSSMQAALGYLGELKMADPKAPEVLNLLELSSKRLTTIADNLLKKYKGEVTEPERFSIHHSLDELVGEFSSQQQYVNVSFVKQYSPNGIYLRGDKTKLQRAFGNILKNAAEAMNFDGKIFIQTTRREQWVNVSISDTGPGLPEETLQKVLQGGYTNGKQNGNGIGMKVVRETVLEYQGRLLAQSKMGSGTTFFMEFPFSSHDAETLTLPLPDKQPVLVVDDDPSLREQWRMALKEYGVEAILCDSYEDMVSQKISSRLTKTAVVDYHFDNSEKNGADVVQYLQREGFTNLVLCTAEYWKPSIQKLAKDLDVKLCPKPLPKIVMSHESWVMSDSKTGQESRGYKVLVIDDDEGIRLSWQVSQAKLGIHELHCYSNLESIQGNGLDLSTIDIAFVDKNIEGSQYSGAQAIAYLKSKGVSKVVLASGERAASLKSDPQFTQADFIIQNKLPSSFKEFFS